MILLRIQNQQRPERQESEREIERKTPKESRKPSSDLPLRRCRRQTIPSFSIFILCSPLPGLSPSQYICPSFLTRWWPSLELCSSDGEPSTSTGEIRGDYGADKDMRSDVQDRRYTQTISAFRVQGYTFPAVAREMGHTTPLSQILFLGEPV